MSIAVEIRAKDRIGYVTHGIVQASVEDNIEGVGSAHRKEDEDEHNHLPEHRTSNDRWMMHSPKIKYK
jgi:hypothetical protein